METAVTSGVRISVVTRWEPSLSNALADNFVFSYYITIENQNAYSVQVLRRHWFIFDASGIRREVEGPGVVGYQPVIPPGGFHTYQSACDLISQRGTMKGYYSVSKLDSGDIMRVEIPKFKLEVPFVLN